MLKLTGIRVRKHELTEWLTAPLSIAWIGVDTEDFLEEESDAITQLKQLSARFPISLHGTALSLGSTDELNWSYLFKLKRLMTHIKPCFVSDHLAWCSLHGRYYHD